MRMGDHWAPFETYNIDLARTPTVQAALASLMEAFGLRAISADDLARIVVPTTLIWGRHDRATPLSVAETASARFGWPHLVIENCADDPLMERPKSLLRALRTTLHNV
ncbi:MAG: alpha/beta hydrolase [Alphaproteobacteria bacterium]